ncbi:mitochondrial carrier protein [Trypanosoma conorhini]|uniref:Mitochondrial carrier protein n=1 Tax=Trypanosoma conorhini TaxID=83891 RepID=A0A422NRG9_9TRYP|nr:mitochondrial carrier protein [Trypanosoma conorhini]RNF08058.1 mitochondrial carrier protein [Trypanosoma conorhini]
MSSANTPVIYEAGEGVGGPFSLLPEEVIAGGAAGFVEHFAMFPFDTIKTRIQSGSSPSIAAALRHVWRSEPLTHLYRGLLPILVSAVPSHGAYFGAYESAKRVFGEETNTSIMLSSSCAVAAHDTIATPFDVVKQRMQMDRTRRFTSSLRCAQHVLAEDGTRIFFVSLPTTILMNVPHYAAYWTVYEGFLSFLGGGRRDKENELAMEYVAAALLAGTTASIVSSPLDVAKTHLQLGKESRVLSVFRNIIRTRGVRGFLAGVSARIMHTAPSGTLMMFTYEMTKKALERR